MHYFTDRMVSWLLRMMTFNFLQRCVGAEYLRDSVSCVDDRWSVVLEIILPDVGGATMAQVGNKNLLAIVRITK